MSPSQFFVLNALSFLTGILLASFDRGSWFPWQIPLMAVAGLGLGFSLVFLVVEYAHSKTKRKTRNIICCFAVLFLCLGIFRFELSLQTSQFSTMLNSKVDIESLVIEDADVRLRSAQLTVRPDGYTQNVLVVAESGRDIRYGDKVLLSGIVTEPEKYEGSDFDYGEYLKMKNIYALMKRPKIILIERGQGSVHKTLLFRVKNFLVKNISHNIAEPQSSLLIGILIGARKTLPAEVVEQFSRTGLSHIIAVSGYNISIIIVFLGFLPKFFGRKVGFALTLLFIVSFVVLTGASSSIVRAGIMGSLLLVAGMVGRPYVVTQSLVASAAIMVLLNPRILFWDKGFQLSFTATAGIVYVLPYLEVLFEKAPDRLGLKSVLLTTFAATWFTWPLLVEGFGRVSLSAPLANLLVLPAIPWLMLFGFCVPLPIVGAGFAYICNLMLLYILKVMAVVSSWKWAALDVSEGFLIFVGALSVSLAGYALIRSISAFLIRKRVSANIIGKYY